MSLKPCQKKSSVARLKKTVDFLKVISEENRLKILCFLQKQETCVCEIWQQIGLPQNLASHHLKVLKNFRLIKSRRQGTKIIYSADQKEIKKYNNYLSFYLK